MTKIPLEPASKTELTELFVLLWGEAIPEDQSLELLQDWDLEGANADRVLDFATVFESTNLSDYQRQELGRLLLASLDEAFKKYGQEQCHQQAMTVARVLSSEPELHAYWMSYWARTAEKDQDWAISPFVRGILARGSES